MQNVSANDIFNFALILSFLYLWVPPVWLLMRFVTPKGLVKRYFKYPHFTSAELVLFSGFPGTLMRTGIFMNLCIMPSRGKKRKMTDIREHVPGWYIIVSKIFMPCALIHGLFAFLLLVGSILYIKFF